MDIDYRYASKMTDLEIKTRTHAAVHACVAARLFPSRDNLWKFGARGSWHRMMQFRNLMITNGEVAISDADRKKAERRPIRGRCLHDMKEQCMPRLRVVKPPRPLPYISPVWDEIVAGHRAWKRVIDWRIWRRKVEVAVTEETAA